MKNSAQRIRTSHVGRLPAPSGFAETALRLARGTRPLKPGEVGSMRESTRERDALRISLRPVRPARGGWKQANVHRPAA
jgi:hypothetical protein